MSGWSKRPALDRRPLLHERRLKRLDRVDPLDQEAVAINHEKPRRRHILRQPGLDHHLQQQAGDTAAGRSGAQDRDALLGEADTGDVDRRQERAGRDRRRPLDVVVEGAQPVAIAVEQTRGVALGKVFPLQQHMRPAMGDGADHRLDKIVVFPAAHPLVAPAQIERVGEPLLVVGADIEHDRQGGRRMQPAAGGVEGELADRDAHAAGPLVAEPQDALAVGQDDRLDPVEARVGQDLLQAMLMRQAQEQAARLPEQLAELLAAGADRRGIDERQQFLEVLPQQREEQGLVVVVQFAQKGVALEIGGKPAQHQEPARDLLLQSADMRRQQSVQAEGVALGLGVGGALVQERVGEQGPAGSRRGQHAGLGSLPAAAKHAPWRRP